jgi:transcriptional regulator with GAF, ATPase, and Fis domain
MGTYLDKSKVKPNVKLSDIATSWLFLCGIGIGISIWFVDPFIDAVFFHEGTFYERLTAHSTHELFMRTIIFSIIIIFSFIGSLLLLRAKSVEKELRKNQQALRQQYHIQNVVSSILQQSLEPVTLKESLGHTLETILSEPLFALKKKGSIFLADSNNEMLNLEVHNGFDEIQQETCSRLPFGRCLCGKVASSHEIIFTGCVDDRHEYRYENMNPHGHYCVPILSGNQVLGVINAYVCEGHKKTQDEEKFLSMIADTLAGIIERKQGEDALKQKTQELGERVKELTAL